MAAPFGVAADATRVYWTDTYLEGLLSCDMPVCTFEELVVLADAPSAVPAAVPLLAADATTLYWTGTGGLRKLDKAPPGAPFTVLDASIVANGIALDDDHVYVTDVSNGSNHRVLRVCKADGSVVEVAANQSAPRGVAVTPSGVVFWANSAGGTIMRATPVP